MISGFLKLSQLTYFVKCRRTLKNTYKFFLAKTIPMENFKSAKNTSSSV